MHVTADNRVNLIIKSQREMHILFSLLVSRRHIVMQASINRKLDCRRNFQRTSGSIGRGGMGKGGWGRRVWPTCMQCMFKQTNVEWIELNWSTEWDVAVHSSSLASTLAIPHQANNDSCQESTAVDHKDNSGISQRPGSSFLLHCHLTAQLPARDPHTVPDFGFFHCKIRFYLLRYRKLAEISYVCCVSYICMCTFVHVHLCMLTYMNVHVDVRVWCQGSFSITF